MKLLIIEDNKPMAELTALLLESVDRHEQRLERITVAGDLETALRFLPAHDVVLCDGRFPLAPGSRFIVEEWDVVHHEAARRGIHFVLYTGSPRSLDHAEEIGAPALAKPAPIQDVYAALARAEARGGNRRPSRSKPEPMRREHTCPLC